ncbi:MAG: branched-chain amino acid ABC transporter permease [Natronomonas sp.]|uniref:branched-chain amino acid ABC transporter permease n=1 Tax=Natronomonas sp. TaxID=2184060 RepID=UPI002870615E|nr:branched-chain amino acid ABC transporter permease [Natronomonas sp.]MDR9432120.1 branched-chain amino acid ABC transporter permease [Natronomonas sp.]
MVAITTTANAVASGALLGIFYALVASGFSMIWASMKLVNVAHAALMFLAGYAAILVVSRLGVPWLAALFVLVPILFLVGAIVYQGILSYSYRTENFETVSLVATFGLAIVVENVLLLYFGPSHQSVNAGFGGIVEVAGMRLSSLRIVSALFAILATVALYYIIYRTAIGRSVRAAWQDQEVAMLYGVNPDRARIVMFGLATALAGIAGVLLPAIRPIAPALHWEYIVIVFIIVIIGSVGSITGTMLVGGGVGIIESTLPLFMPSSWVTVVLYVVLLAFLLYRPDGLFEGWA